MNEPRPIALDYSGPLKSPANYSRFFDIPTFIAALLVCAVLSFVAMFIVPAWEPELKNWGGELPALTRLVISFSHLLLQGGWLAAAIVPFVLSLVVAKCRSGRPPTTRSAGITIGISILLLFLLLGLIVLSLMMPIYSVARAIPGSVA
jgi:hypothetical protein